MDDGKFILAQIMWILQETVQHKFYCCIWIDHDRLNLKTKSPLTQRLVVIQGLGTVFEACISAENLTECNNGSDSIIKTSEKKNHRLVDFNSSPVGTSIHNSFLREVCEKLKIKVETYCITPTS